MDYQNEHKITTLNDYGMSIDINAMNVSDVKIKIESYLNLFELKPNEVEISLHGKFYDMKRNSKWGCVDLNFDSFTQFISLDKITNKFFKVKYSDSDSGKKYSGNLIPQNDGYKYSEYSSIKVEVI